MSNGPKKITELPVANTYANTDLVLLVGNVSTNATTYSVTPAVLFANVNATRINVGNTVNVGANNIINATAHFITSNSTVNAVMTATSLTFSNTTAVPFTANVTGVYTTGTVNATSYTVGSNFIANSTATTIAANTLTLGTSTISNTLTATVATANTTGGFSCGNSTLAAGHRVTISGTLAGTGTITGYTSPTTYKVSAVTGTSPNVTGFTLTTEAGGALTTSAGTLTGLTYTTDTTNGYSYLPNGLKINFGRFIANTTSQVTFTSPFATAVMSISVTPANTVYLAANVPYVFTSNTTTANIYSASTTTSSNCYYLAIGY